jgi:hypothetical protein
MVTKSLSTVFSMPFTELWEDGLMQAYFELLHIPQTFAIITKQHNVQQT